MRGTVYDMYIDVINIIELVSIPDIIDENMLHKFRDTLFHFNGLYTINCLYQLHHKFVCCQTNCNNYFSFILICIIVSALHIL